MSDLATLDLSDTAFWTRPIAARAAAFAELRGRPGLTFLAEPEVDGYDVARGPGYYSAVRLADVAGASNRPDLFRSGSGATSIFDIPEEFLEFFGSMINMDNPRHSRLRRIVSQGFTPRRLADLRARIDAHATGLVDAVVERGHCDWAVDVASRMPLEIICDLMGVPAEFRATVFDQSRLMFGLEDPEILPPGADPAMTLLGAGMELAAVMHELAAHRAEHPADDLTSALVEAEVDGDRLTPDELASFFILLVAAGTETTRNALSWGVHALSEHPDQRAMWASDVDGVAATAVEEIVRWASPIIFMRRTVAAPTELAGTSLHPGDKVVLWYWSANRDERYFADPERFDVRRDPNPHVGFGGPGPHFCLGAHLARAEIRAVLTETMRRIPDITVAGEPEPLTSMFSSGLKRLPVEFTPGRRAAS